MTTFPRPFALLTLVAAVFFAGCEQKPVEVTRQMQTEVANLMSEVEFALQLRDFARAEPLLVKAVGIIPDAGDHWILLGTTRKQLQNTSGARDAYRQALAAFERAAKRAPDSGEPRLQQVYVYALLGQVDQARKQLERAAKDLPNDREVQEFVRANALDRILADPNFKAGAL